MDKLVDESKIVGVLLVIVLLVLKIVFHSSSFFSVLKLTLGLFWLFFIPGYFLLFSLPSLSSLERLIMSFILGTAFYGAVGYNLGVIGVSFALQVYVVPLLGVLIGCWFLFREKK
ncbi:MAG: hypothetical protein O2779_01740 [Nanoarchaeota archaeon]|nr:hypothetical protein [Nanoarchaeota archaeon]